jgi:hypothetical protein
MRKKPPFPFAPLMENWVSQASDHSLSISLDRPQTFPYDGRKGQGEGALILLLSL